MESENKDTVGLIKTIHSPFMKKWITVAYNIKQSDTKTFWTITCSCLFALVVFFNYPIIGLVFALWMPIVFLIPNEIEFSFERMRLDHTGKEELDSKYFVVKNNIEYFNYKLYEKELSRS